VRELTVAMVRELGLHCRSRRWRGLRSEPAWGAIRYRAMDNCRRDWRHTRHQLRVTRCRRHKVWQKSAIRPKANADTRGDQRLLRARSWHSN